MTLAELRGAPGAFALGRPGGSPKPTASSSRGSVCSVMILRRFGASTKAHVAVRKLRDWFARFPYLSNCASPRSATRREDHPDARHDAEVATASREEVESVVRANARDLRRTLFLLRGEGEHDLIWVCGESSEDIAAVFSRG